MNDDNNDDFLVNTSKIPTEEELYAELEKGAAKEMAEDFARRAGTEKDARVNAEYGQIFADSAAKRHQKDAETYKRRAEVFKALVYKLRHDGKCRDIGFVRLAEEMGKIEADVDALAFWHGYVGEVSNDYSALIEKNQKLDLRNGALAGENERLTAKKEDLEKRLAEAEKTVAGLFVMERKADNRAEALEQEVRAYNERYGDISPAPLPRPGYFARLYRLAAKVCRKIIE